VVIAQHCARDPRHIGHPLVKFTIPLIEEVVGCSYPLPETVGDPSRDPKIFVLDEIYQLAADLISSGRARYLH
jgi:hypothetical protein